MPASFQVYIDESGDEGFSFDLGSSEWFVLAGVIVRTEDDSPVVRVVDSVRQRLNKPRRKVLHFRDLKHKQKLVYVDEVSRRALRVISVLVHKPSLREPEIFRAEYRLYFYMARYLLERVSWYCRGRYLPDDFGDGTADLIFSNRSATQFEVYLRLLRRLTDTSDVRIDWGVINTEQITAYNPGKRMGLQVADAAAGAFSRAVEPDTHGFTEDHYLRILKPVIYHYRGRYLGYGAKIWPREAHSFLEREGRLDWLMGTTK